MDYFKLIKEGNKLKFTFKNYQQDGFDNKWYIEIWYKIQDNQYACEYDDCLELDKSIFREKIAESLIKENMVAVEMKNATVDIIDKNNLNEITSEENVNVKGNLNMINTQEGYAVFNKSSKKYVDNSQYEVNNFREAEVYNTKEEAQDEFRHMDSPEDFVIHKVEMSVKIIKEYVRKITFEEV